MGLSDAEIQRRLGLFEAISWSTVAIGPPKEVPFEKFSHGSGVCVDFRGSIIIATARHVVRELEELGFPPTELAILARPPEPLRVDFTGRIPRRVTGLHAQGPISLPITGATFSSPLEDLAVLHIRGKAEDYKEVRFHVFDPKRASPEPGDGILVAGLAEEMMVTPGPDASGSLPIGVNQYFLESQVVDSRGELLKDYEPSFHYLSDFETGDETSGDTGGYLQTPRGMSGGGTWRPVQPPGPAWQPIASLSGIQLSWYPKPRLIKVARVERLATFLESGVTA